MTNYVTNAVDNIQKEETDLDKKNHSKDKPLL
jgi:hypothetical protein